MIKANELRIGNLCWDIHSKELLEVTALSNEGPVGFAVVNRDKYPLPDGWQAAYIPLTPEWLERMGFEKSGPQTWVERLDEYSLLVIFDDNTYELLDIVEHMSVRSYDNRIEFVHRLQNLYFALTGEELTIKEPA